MNNTRDQIVDVADQLFYQQGFDHTSFSHIAELVNISRGNFYYHFKTKDEILDAVIDLRLQKTESMLSKWEEEGDTPIECIRSFINIMIMNQNKIKLYGCPVGTLCSELSKLNHVSRNKANKLFVLFRVWLVKQFELLGCKSNADDLAIHLLVNSQGIATLASAFHDDKIIKKEVIRLHEWLNQNIPK